jgi:beta-mannanase
VQIRFAPECNGNWYPWSISALAQNNEGALLYAAAFRHVHDRFTRAGASNVRWVWCINSQNVPDVSWNDPIKAYPGDAYVDIISIDGYNFGNSLPSSRWQSFSELFSRPYTAITRHLNLTKKPLMISESLSSQG